MKKIGIVGAGFIAYKHAKGIKEFDNICLGGVFDIDTNKLNDIVAKYGGRAYVSFEEMLEDESIDIIDICLPTPLHYDYAMRTISARKAMLLEKPIALSYKEAKEIVDEAEKNNVPMMVGQSLRFKPEYIKAKEYIDAGRLGKIKQVYAARLGQRPSWRNWNNSAKKAGGVLYDLMLHDIDYLYSIFGKIDNVYAAGTKCQDGGFEDIFATLNFANGVKALVDGSAMMPKGFPFTMELRVDGTEGTIAYRFVGGENTELCRESSLIYYQNEKEPICIETDQFSNHGKELSYFADCIESGRRTSLCDPAETVSVMKVLETITEIME